MRPLRSILDRLERRRHGGWTRAEWVAFHNPSCPEPEEHTVEGVFKCVTLNEPEDES
jgi:hypothetical protein